MSYSCPVRPVAIFVGRSRDCGRTDRLFVAYGGEALSLHPRMLGINRRVDSLMLYTFYLAPVGVEEV